MNSYFYTATDADGNIQHGTLDATDIASAIARLAEMHLVAQAVSLRDEASVAQERQAKAFEGNLNQLLAQRDEWVPALNAACSELPNGSTRRELHGLSRLLRSPQFEVRMPDLLLHPTILQLLPLLEQPATGKAPQNPLIQWLSGILKKHQLRTEQPRKRFIYPAVLLGLTLLILIGFAYFLTPIFREMFDEFGLLLPGPTVLTFWIADQLTKYLLRSLGIILCLLLVLVPCVRFWRSHSLSNRLLGRLVAGTSTNLLAMSTMTSTLSHMLGLGAPLTGALRIAGKASRSFYYERAVIELSNQIEQSPGTNLKLSSGVLPPSLLYALQAEQGGLPSRPMLNSLAQVYSDRAQSRVDWLTTILPFLVILGIGLGVGFVVISLFMPLVSLVTSLA